MIKTGIVRGVAVGVVLMMLMTTYRSVYLFLFRPQQIVVTCDQQLSSACAEQIKNRIVSTLTSDSSCTNLMADVKQQFPCIDWMSIAYQPTGNIDVSIVALQPRGIVNNTTLVLPGNIYVPKDVYTERAGATTLPLTVVNDETMQQAAAFCYSRIDNALFQQYSIGWLDDNNAWLIDKQNSRCAILWSAALVPDAQILKHCEHLFTTALAARSNQTLGKNVCFVADCRFNRQIVFYQYKADRGVTIPFELTTTQRA